MATSCSKRIEIQTYADIDCLSRGFERRASFFISTNTKDTNPLLSKEVTKKTGKILKNNGYKVKDKQSAQYHLVITYGKEAEKRTVRVPVPVAQTHITKTRRGDEALQAAAYGYQNGTSDSAPNAAHGVGFTTTQIAFLPQDVNVFNKSILLQVYDMKKNHDSDQGELIWHGAACNVDEDSDLRNSLDYLLISSFKYFGKNTQRSIQVYINENDKSVKNMRKAYTHVPKK